MSDTQCSLNFDALALLVKALDAQQTGMCLFDSEDRVVRWNRTYLDIFPEEADILQVGLPYQETLRRFYEVNLPSEELAFIERHLSAGLTRHQRQHSAFLYQRKDGRWISNDVLRLEQGWRLNLWRDVTDEGPGPGDWPELRDAFSSIAVAYALFDADGGFVSANSAYTELFPEAVDLNLSGTSYREHLRRHASHVLDEHEQVHIERLCARRDLNAAGVWKNALTFRRRDGGWLQLEERPTRSGGLISFWYDVTERVEAQAQLTTLQERISDAVESITDGFALFDSDDRLVLCNSRYREHYNPLCTDVVQPGVSWAELARIGAERGQYPEALGRVEQWLAQRQAQRLRGDGSATELLLNDGTWLRVSDRRTRDGGIVGIRTDITDLKHSEQRFRTIAESIAVLITAADGLAEVLYASPPTADLFGFSLPRLREMRAMDFFADREQHRSLAQRVANTLLLENVEVVLKRADGSVFPAALTSRRIVYDGRDAYISSVLDLSERQAAEQLRRAKQAADEANRAKSQFLAHMSHELRTPLNAILGYAQILRRDAGLNDKQRDALTTIHTAGEHLLGLINDILDLSKIESSKLDVHVGVFSLGKFLSGVERIFRYRAEEKGLEFRQRIDARLPDRVRGDEQKLRQVIVNLLGNAIKFTDRGYVEFAAQRCGADSDGGYADANAPEQVCFSVTDSGYGVRVEDLERIFQPFQQAVETRHLAEGTGLGLTISRTMVELLGGTLRVESEFGKGSRFWFNIALPAVSSDVLAMPSQQLIIGYRGARQRVLVVDDNAENRAVLMDMLKPLGFILAEADNGRAALERARSFSPQAVLMDLRMPVLDGFQAIRRLRRLPGAARLVIIGVSASAFVADRERCLKAGADAFLAKPFRQESLLALLAQYLALQWIHEDPAVPAAAPGEPFIYPEGDELNLLHNLVLQGDIKTLLEQAERLANSDSRYRSFASELGVLAKGFQLKKIERLLAGAHR